MKIKRAYSVLTVKSIDEDKGEISGIATTPSTDRHGDIVEPKGAEFTLPIPLLWQHNANQPIGTVTKAKVTKDGIEIVASIARGVTERIDEAWALIKAGLVRGLSIGFTAEEFAYMDDGGIRFSRWKWLELSAVTIPANAEASIQSVKSADRKTLAALGNSGSLKPGVSGAHSKVQTMTLKEKMLALKQRRDALAAQMAEMMERSASAGETLSDEDGKLYDEQADEVAKIDVDLKRMERLEGAAVEKATEIKADRADSAAGASGLRGGVTFSKSNLPKGTAFTRYVMATARARGSSSDAINYIQSQKHWMQQTPEVLQFAKAVAGSTQDGNWAAPFVEPVTNEFVELLRPATIIGRIQGFRAVPFNTRVLVQTGGSTVGWVGEGAVKPTGELTLDTASLSHAKVAGIVVLTDELVRDSSPSAEATVRQDLTAQVARFLDGQFLDSTVAATANNPASVTNGVTAVAASGTTAEALYYDLSRVMAPFVGSDMDLTAGVWVMRPGVALGISLLRNALGQPEFPSMTMNGGTLMGLPAITSNAAPAGMVALVNASEVFLADDGSVTIDASREATLDMAGGGAPVFSLWQRNCVAIRAERGITWRKRRAGAVTTISGAAYGPAAPETP